MMKLLESRHEEQTLVMPAMELLRMHYYTQNRTQTESMTIQVHVPGVGDVEFKENCLSPSTKRAIEKDCIAAMQRRMGI